VDKLRVCRGAARGAIGRRARALFLGLVAHSSPLFLVNGNHEQAAACNLDGTPNNVAVWAQTARNRLFSQPAPDGFYTGRDWLHCNSLDHNPQLGQIIVNSVQGELYVIDHDGTFVAGGPGASIARAAGPAGGFLYRFGDPAPYAQGDPPRILENWDNATSGHRQMGGSHNAHWIPAGLPGGGHLMVFNNGQYLFERTPQSSIIEINPFLNEAGKETGRSRPLPHAAPARRQLHVHHPSRLPPR